MLSPGPISANAHVAARPGGSCRAASLWLALLILAIAAATILGALGFEHIGGYQPCALCLMQRTPYYVGVPVAAATLLAVLFACAAAPARDRSSRSSPLLMLYGGGLAVYHSGVEWGFWEGPASCAPSVGVAARRIC